MTATDKKRSLLILGVAAILLAVIGYGIYDYWIMHHEAPKPVPVNNSTNKTAIIYDSLSREYPNDTLIEDLVSLLEEYNYTVYVYRGVNATLDPLVTITRFDLVIIRAHGAYNGNDTHRPLGSYIYTGLTYEEAKAIYDGYIDSMLNKGEFALAIIPPPGVQLNETIIEQLPKYVAVSPKYLNEQLGSFKNDSIVIWAGCYGANDDRLANVFLDKGAKSFIAWNGGVTQHHMDYVLLETVKYLVENNDPSGLKQHLGTAVTDPFAGGTLEVYVKK